MCNQELLHTQNTLINSIQFRYANTILVKINNFTLLWGKKIFKVIS